MPLELVLPRANLPTALFHSLLELPTIEFQSPYIIKISFLFVSVIVFSISS